MSAPTGPEPPSLDRDVDASARTELPAVGLGAAVGTSRRRIVRRLVRRPAGVVGIVLTGTVVAVGLLAPVLAPFDPFAVVGPSLSPPSGAHPMGTDALGRDLLSGVIFGARTSLVVAGLVGVLVLVLGVVVGTISSYLGGWTDDLLMRMTELFQVLPRFFLAIVIVAVFGSTLPLLILVLGLTSWPLLARVIRAEVLILKQREFVDAARVAGASGLRLVVREILPNALPAVSAFLGLVLAQVLLIEASLGFIGLGDPNVVSWGYLASQAQRFLRVAWWMSVFPGLAIAATVLGLNLVSDALSDVLGRSR
ncbi:MAG: ABC transporter permease [Actinobacteria bacterium]|nr:ABC transporter permease [Actinomycetota bacterium]